MTKRLTEKEFLQQVRDLARLYHWLVYHTENSRRSEPGFPDLVLVRGTTVLFVELKIPPNRPTAEQAAWLAALQDAGCYARVWTPADWPTIEETLQRRKPT